jgi:hypothetical protein
MQDQATQEQLFDLVEEAYSYLRFMPLRNINRKLREAPAAKGRFSVLDTKKRRSTRRGATSTVMAVHEVSGPSQCAV